MGVKILNDQVKANLGQVLFVGAGPGDPDLITLKGKKALEEADRVIYAGSLVNPEILKHCREGITLFDSAGLTLEETIAIMVEGVSKGEKVVRLHTGDPSVYGAIQEQMQQLDALTITYGVVPGVSSVFAAAAAIKKEFTLPEVSQTLILTRLAGRTPVPEKEDLALLAQHQASMAIFLSVQEIGEVVESLGQSYPPDTPVAIVYRASWPDEQILEGTLATIEQRVKEAGIRKHAQILVGDFLRDKGARSKLYDPEFTHEYRKGSSV
ncbi:precorrin-4 C(11)-methyltransferase [Desulfitobacterium sp. THU1]|uniref:precorrin-4 C(11)-methyltransferase n=1 Tax=Desulfitobacterium sp. THU1 TaxID=3138072 RepID=UPI0031203BEF